MNNLVKIREISVRYNVSARTLRYYEDMGLIESKRSGEYAYRLYDEAAIKRLEQILILRRLNISIKDIKRIFGTKGSEVVLNVLEKKVENIDEEVSLLHELKTIILEFIEQIKKLDFEKETDIKLLYEKAKDIETQITRADYKGNPAIAERFFAVTEKLNDKVPDITIVRIPKFRAVTSGAMSYDDIFGKFQLWQESHDDFFLPIIFDAPDFLCENNGSLEWIWRIKDEITEADVTPYEIIEHPGGLYAATVSIDGDDESGDKVMQKIKKWIEKTNFVIDGSRATSVHMIYADDEIRKGLGYHQLNFYAPIKLKDDI
ncbi:MAG: MerR family transcriptional regulator [Oscillospiraceae bacterium]|nr:MerR family transcriptional regulator [Oscillospiraceae bacterium]